MSTLKTLRSRVKEKSAALLSGGEAPTSSLSGDSSKDPVQVEPKTYFANERTFIQWISAALLLLTVSSIMMGSGNYNGTSSVIAFSSLILVTYAAFVYFRRVKLLQSGEAYGYLDFLGPSILAAGVGIGVFIVFADAVKGSDLFHWATTEEGGKKYKDDDDRRLLFTSGLEEDALPSPVAYDVLREKEGTCTRHGIEGTNLLEYQPRDVLVDKTFGTRSNLMVATTQALIAHSTSTEGHDLLSKTLVSELPDVQFQSITKASDNALWVLSTGPFRTELIAFDGHSMELVSRVTIQDVPTKNGSMVFVPMSSEEDPSQNHTGKFYVYLDGTMHTYHLDQRSEDSSSDVSRIGSINMKVLNRGEDTSILAMEHFEGITYLLRPMVVEAWDLQAGTFLSQVDLPMGGAMKPDDQWVGLALERQGSYEEVKTLRGRRETLPSVLLHMLLDSFPPQLWSFRLTEGPVLNEHATLNFSGCGGDVTLN